MNASVASSGSSSVSVSLYFVRFNAALENLSGFILEAFTVYSVYGTEAETRLSMLTIKHTHGCISVLVIKHFLKCSWDC